MSDLVVNYNNEDLTTIRGGESVKLNTANTAIGDINIINKTNEQQSRHQMILQGLSLKPSSSSVGPYCTVKVGNTTYSSNDMTIINDIENETLVTVTIGTTTSASTATSYNLLLKINGFIFREIISAKRTEFTFSINLNSNAIIFVKEEATSSSEEYNYVANISFY